MLKNHENQIQNNEVQNSFLVSKDYMNEKKSKQQVVYLNGQDLRYVAALTTYVEDYSSYGNMEWIQDEKNLIWGRKPRNDNEIMVREDVAEDLGITNDKQENTTFELRNLWDDKYQGCYDEYQNLYDYFPSGVKVVGVFSTVDKVNEGDYVDYLVTDTVYQQLLDQYYETYIYNSYLFHVVDENYVTSVQTLYENVYYIDTTMAIYIDSFHVFLENMSAVLSSIVIASAILVSFLLISFIGYHIKDSSKTIGILRTLGVYKKDTIRVFLYESLMISIPVILLANLIGIYGIRYISSRLAGIAKNDAGQFIMIEPYLWILVDILICLFTILVTMIPIHKMSKKKPIDLLNS